MGEEETEDTFTVEEVSDGIRPESGRIPDIPEGDELDEAARWPKEV